MFVLLSTFDLALSNTTYFMDRLLSSQTIIKVLLSSITTITIPNSHRSITDSCLLSTAISDTCHHHRCLKHNFHPQSRTCRLLIMLHSLVVVTTNTGPYMIQTTRTTTKKSSNMHNQRYKTQTYILSDKYYHA